MSSEARVRLLFAARSPAQAQSSAHIEGQAGIADRRDMPGVKQILGLGVEVHPVVKLVAAADIKLGIAMIQVAIRQEQAVA